MRTLCGQVIALIFISGIAFSAFSADVKVHINSSVVMESCDVDSDSKNINVNIGDFLSHTFPNIGSVSPKKEFDINLKGCSGAIQGATVTFTGNSDHIDHDLLSLSDASGQGGMASGVGVQILERDGTTMLPLGKPSTMQSLQPGNNTLKFYLRYKSTEATVSEGNASAVMYFDLKYK